MEKRTADILRAIIDEYVKTAEPVSSKAIMFRYDVGISSATIRNEMAELEKEGYITQPHTSAGRVPTEKGYRFYVDRILTETEQFRKLDHILERILFLLEVDEAIQRMSRMLSNHTEYASLGLVRQDRGGMMQSLHLLSANQEEYLLVVVQDNKKIAHRIIRSKKDDDLRIDLISSHLNNRFAGKTAMQIERTDVGPIDSFDQKNRDFIRKVTGEIVHAMRENDRSAYCVTGYEKLLSYPEFSHAADAREVFEGLNNREKLYGIICGQDGGLKITIGNENAMVQLSKVSIATRTIKLGEREHITLGIAGPVRMNYRKVILSFADIGRMLDRMLKEIR